MHPAATRRAGASLVAFFSAPSCRIAERHSSRSAAQAYQKRAISCTSTRRQQTAPAPASSQQPTRTPLPPTAASRVEKDQHALSPSEDQGKLRSLTDGLQDPPPTLSENEKQVDWTRSYHGLSSSPFTADQASILQQPIEFDDIEIKPDGIIYLPEIKYRRILNRVFGPGGWGLAPRGETIVTGKLVTREYALVCGGR